MKLTTDSTLELKNRKGYRLYELNEVEGKILAKHGSPASDSLPTDPTYGTGTLSKNQKEFGVASMMSKVLRDSLSVTMSEICESYVSGRLTAQFRNLAKLEEGQLGRRPLYPSKHGNVLNGFEFNTNAPYDEIFGAKYFVKAGSRKGQVILHFPAFVPETTFVKPEGATNFKINARLVALSDYHYNSVSKSYEALHSEYHGQFGSFESSMLPILRMPTEPMTSQVSLNEANLPEELGLFLVMAVSFFRYENGHFHHLTKESGMRIKQVY